MSQRERERDGDEKPHENILSSRNSIIKPFFQSDLQRNRWRGEPKLLSRASFLFESFLKSKSVCDRNAERKSSNNNTHTYTKTTHE